MKENTTLYEVNGECENIELWQLKKVIIQFFGKQDHRIWFEQKKDVVSFDCENISCSTTRQVCHNQILGELKKYNKDVRLQTEWNNDDFSVFETYGMVTKNEYHEPEYVNPHPIIDTIVAGLVFCFICFILLSFVVHPITICEGGAYCAMYARNLTLTDPTFAELQSFVANDYTELNEYDARTYNCEDFTEDVIMNARSQGYKVGYVFIEGGMVNSISILKNERTGHAIACFQTTDRGLYFLEPQLDVLFSEAEMDEMVSNRFYDIAIDGESFGMGIRADPEINWCHFVLSQIL